MAQRAATINELKQRSHDYSLRFVEAIFGAFGYLSVFAGALFFAASTLAPQVTCLLIGSVLFTGGSILVVLLATLRTLKDIRLNTRESLAFQEKGQTKGMDAPARDGLPKQTHDPQVLPVGNTGNVPAANAR